MLPGAASTPRISAPQPHLDYRLQAVLQAPTMEELNHIWTTQGGELAYRLSAAYEFALIPIEPLDHRAPAGPMTLGDPRRAAFGAEAEPGRLRSEIGAEARALPLAATGPDKQPPPADFLPTVLFSQRGRAVERRAPSPPATAAIEHRALRACPARACR